jgi:tRNA A-37 threonylcarbamoyl transferase component Bud32/dienelactone hydrolase
MKCAQCHAENNDSSRFCSNCATPLSHAGSPTISLTKTIETPAYAVSTDSLIASKYKIVEEIGQGGMGIVYKAEDLRLKRHIALKFLPPHLMDSPELKERFLIEAQAAAALNHPNICVIHEVGESEERPYIAMEYVDGETLRDKLRAGPLKPQEALDIAIQITSGLGEAHRKGIIHRDIKSANIMVTDKGQAKVMDFGLAKLRGGSSLTKSQTTLGTVAYMSPEQAQGEDVDSRTDLWSLGVVLYEMLTGELPFKGDRDVSVIYSIVHAEPRSLKIRKPPVPEELQQVVGRALKKKREARYASAEDMLKDLRAYRTSLQMAESGVLNLKTLARRLRKPKVAGPTVAALALLAFAGVRFFQHQAKVRWAKQVAIPEIERRIGENNVWRDLAAVYRLAEEAERYIPRDPKLSKLIAGCSFQININTEPQGAKISMKEYMSPDSEWTYLGVSPIEKIRLPIGIFRWKIEKDNYETVLAAASTWGPDLSKHDVLGPNDLSRVLDKAGTIPPGMVRVKGEDTPLGKLPDFFIDRCEVTNRQFKDFVSNGGYRNRKYWTQKFVEDGKELRWEEAVKGFVDQTGQPGPSTWQAGDYPEGQGGYPVSGVCWYEAAAYAEFAGKNLPTGEHWGITRGEYTTLIRVPQLGGFAILAPFSNFRGKGPVPAGSLPGLTAYGALDMAGTVREWCWNETAKGRLIRGGAWDDNPYIFGNLSQAPSMERSPRNGFRCALYPDPKSLPAAVFQAVKPVESRDLYKEKPVPGPVFQVYKEQFSYDKTELKADIESRQEGPDWIHETVTFDAAYGGERVMAHLFLPKNSAPPYQVVIYFPGSASIDQRSSQEIEIYYEFPMFLSFIVKNGRAALYPVYKGTFERGSDTLAALLNSGDLDSHQAVDLFVQDIKDLRRCVDYLETRPDLDGQKIAYYGMSWGAALGVYVTAIEDRLKASILLGGSMNGLGRPEINDINYVGRVKVPTLMLNGKYDTLSPVETTIKPMFDLLGTPAAQKEWKLYETDHIPPITEYIKETLAWLDKYLGPVKR